VLVGRPKTGPTPQVTFDSLGEKKSEKMMSLVPKVGSPPGPSAGCATNGRMNRPMRFHFS
jgi:hypothetical protein